MHKEEGRYQRSVVLYCIVQIGPSCSILYCNEPIVEHNKLLYRLCTLHNKPPQLTTVIIYKIIRVTHSTGSSLRKEQSQSLFVIHHTYINQEALSSSLKSTGFTI